MLASQKTEETAVTNVTAVAKNEKKTSSDQNESDMVEVAESEIGDTFMVKKEWAELAENDEDDVYDDNYRNKCIQTITDLPKWVKVGIGSLWG